MMKLKEKLVKNNMKKKDSSQPRLIYQTLDSGHENVITSWKVNKNKL